MPSHLSYHGLREIENIVLNMIEEKAVKKFIFEKENKTKQQSKKSTFAIFKLSKNDLPH